MTLPPICQVCGGEACSRLDRHVHVSQGCPGCGALGLHVCPDAPSKTPSNDEETRELLKELLRASVREAVDAAIYSLGGKVHNTPHGIGLLGQAVRQQLKQRGLTMAQACAVFRIRELMSLSAGYHPVPEPLGNPKPATAHTDEVQP